MTALERLIAALHTAGGETVRTSGEWLELAQSHSGLLEAFRGVFGKRLPTAQKFGLWASEHLGATSGELILQGRHSPRRKQWVYRVATKARLEELARQAAEVRAMQDAKFQTIVEERLRIDTGHVARELKRQDLNRPPALTVTVQAPEPLTTTRPGPDGRPVTETLRGRDGEPLKSHPTAPANTAPIQAPEPARAGPNTEPPETVGLTPRDGQWFNGCGRPRSALERFRLGRAAGQGRVEHSAPGSHFQDDLPRGQTGGEYGFDDPGGVVTQNINGRRRKWSTAGDWGL